MGIFQPRFENEPIGQSVWRDVTHWLIAKPGKGRKKQRAGQAVGALKRCVSLSVSGHDMSTDPAGKSKVQC
jgi:hypothetical protein